jgi:hypothetical protein
MNFNTKEIKLRGLLYVPLIGPLLAGYSQIAAPAPTQVTQAQSGQLPPPPPATAPIEPPQAAAAGGQYEEPPVISATDLLPVSALGAGIFRPAASTD